MASKKLKTATNIKRQEKEIWKWLQEDFIVPCKLLWKYTILSLPQKKFTKDGKSKIRWCVDHREILLQEIAADMEEYQIDRRNLRETRE